MVEVIEQYTTPFVKNVLELPPSVIRKMWKQGKIKLIDVRTPEEYEDHHIPGSLLVPLDYLEYLKDLFEDHEVGVVCEHGNRARYATYGMPHLYKKKAYVLQGGMEYWMSMGYEVESGVDDNGKLWRKLLKERL
ncbi:rhodanese-like domain-containing protein [Sulfuracidifex tepidarius]|uniref:Thiosulfate sulfurtransferase GlpE n=1 Tax=Sulfuracidifex tepidarius TaxID=1294262 RepID=A0A510DZ15_9CREN|nr:rhodanese-like domain-containing protein [Sulfuracidifex tepidarius]BBG25486.1 Thiosulfate sulfurtransferase GlpE [Sulfuracidifex tepidarius]BBG28280.1 Thiosulfate sulfurtransferase GlpE [Sulfuracidifex tepidarius]